MSIEKAISTLKISKDLVKELKENNYELVPIMEQLNLLAQAYIEVQEPVNPYKNELNSIRISTHDLFKITFELKQNDLETVGLEDLIRSLAIKYQKSKLDKT